MDSVSHKTCTRCLKSLPATYEYWSPSKLGKLGLNSRCKKCLADIAREERAAKGAITRPNRKQHGTKQCSKCDGWYPATNEYFGVCSHHTDGLRSWCRWCLRNTNKNYQHKRRLNPEVVSRERNYDKIRRSDPDVKIREREYAHEHAKDPVVKAYRKQYSREYEQRPDRKLSRRTRAVIIRAKRRSAEGKYARQDIELHLKTQKGLCWWCGKPHGDNYEIDHRIPLSRGGSNWPNNICISCFDCNRSKHNKLPHEFNGRLL